MKSNILRVKNLSITIENNNLLHNIDMVISAHDFVFLTGNNGSGKSTFLNILSKYQPPMVTTYKVSGSIEYNGNEKYPDYNILDKKESQWYNREIYYLKQNLESQGTIYQKFQLVLNPIGVNVSKDDIINEFQKYDVFTERLKLSQNKKWYQKDFLDQPIGSLSGGQQKILEILAMIMRARISSIKLLFIDEPFNHLDVKNIKKVVELILKIRKINPELAIIVATHCMAFPSPCAGVGNEVQIEADFFKHYIVVDGSIRPALGTETYKQGSCFLDTL